MFRNNRVKKMVIGGAVALVLTAGLATTSVLLPVTANAQARAGFQNGPGDRAGFHEEGNGHSFLADALGISVEEVEAAVASARQAGLEQAVAEGLITQEEADRMAERQGFGRRGHKGGKASFAHGQLDGKPLLAEALGISVEALDSAMAEAHESATAEAIETGRITQEEADLMAAHRALRDYVDRDEIVATVLGLSSEELDAAREAGQSVRDLIRESDLDREALQAAMSSAHQAAIDEALADGVISPAQAELLENSEGERFGGHGRRGGRGSHGPGGDRQRPTPDGSSNFRGDPSRIAPEGTL